MNEIYTISEVSNILDVTTQAVYKRLQQDQDSLDEFVTSKGGRKSLTKEGVLKLAELMGIDEPFKEEDEETESVENQTEVIEAVTNAQDELLDYLREDNKRLQTELAELKKELESVRSLREADRKSAEDERRQHEEARMRADALLMRAIMNQNPPRLIDRIFRRNKKKNDETEHFEA